MTPSYSGVLRVRAHALIVAAYLLTSQLPASGATIIVGNGGSVVDAVFAAANNDIIEIQSNDTFIGTLTWKNKFLTIRAASGFLPTIIGDTGSAIQSVNGTVGTGGAVSGLRIADVALSASSVQFTDFTLRQNIIGKVTLGGTGDYHLNASVIDNSITDGVVIAATGNMQLNAQFEDNSIFQRVLTLSGGNSLVDLKVNRNRIEGGLVTTASDNLTTVHAANNLILQTLVGGDGAGIALSGPPLSHGIGTFVNNTIVGFQTGIVVDEDTQASFANMVLKNVDDVGTFAGGTITYSLFSDGTLPPGVGNISATPQFNPNYSLQPTSPGIDVGNDAAVVSPLIDLRGFPRIRDGNGDGIAHVDMGAFEAFSTVPEPGTGLMIAFTIAIAGANRRRARLPLRRC